MVWGGYVRKKLDQGGGAGTYDRTGDVGHGDGDVGDVLYGDETYGKVTSGHNVPLPWIGVKKKLV
jgi:hypothetical protein